MRDRGATLVLMFIFLRHIGGIKNKHKHQAYTGTYTHIHITVVLVFNIFLINFVHIRYLHLTLLRSQVANNYRQPSTPWGWEVDPGETFVFPRLLILRQKLLLSPNSKNLYKTGNCFALKNNFKAARLGSGVLRPTALQVCKAAGVRTPEPKCAALKYFSARNSCQFCQGQGVVPPQLSFLIQSPSLTLPTNTTLRPASHLNLVTLRVHVCVCALRISSFKQMPSPRY